MMVYLAIALLGLTIAGGAGVGIVVVETASLRERCLFPTSTNYDKGHVIGHVTALTPRRYDRHDPTSC